MADKKFENEELKAEALNDEELDNVAGGINMNGPGGRNANRAVLTAAQKKATARFKMNRFLSHIFRSAHKQG